ncbi:fimbrial protein [Volucribacter amazonae]|uniref:Fimbrial-type adhesion domain-containing protein n=1 Tax=Volucribacter amazonae TaxID=256731 RepID=A0A9X4PAS6_9PAST|nr:fimbrial protein [Volucribacter amazonae]MDG6894737.1 hypothetical protein [Volucribacter amazonae]
MKKLVLATLITASLGFSQLAGATQGTITFNGTITDATCKVKIGSEDTNGTVTLPTVSKTVLNADGKTAGTTPFTITLSECSGLGTLTSAKPFFETNSDVNTTSGRLVNTLTTGNATNVEIQLLLDDASTAINIASSNQGIAAQPVTSNQSQTYNFYAQYYATGASTAGDVTAKATYTIAYE